MLFLIIRSRSLRCKLAVRVEKAAEWLVDLILYWERKARRDEEPW